MNQPPTILQSLIAERWLGTTHGTPLHSAVNGALIHHTHAEVIDFGEAVQHARKAGVPALLEVHRQQRAHADLACMLHRLAEVDRLGVRVMDQRTVD